MGAVKLATANIADCFILRDVFREDPYGDYILGQSSQREEGKGFYSLVLGSWLKSTLRAN